MHKKLKLIIFALIFLEGFLLLGLEFASSLIIKPFFGTSLEVWTVIISLTSFSLAIGYLIGSLFVRKNWHFLINYLYFLLTFSIIAIPFTAKSMFRSMIDYDLLPLTILTIISFLTLPLILLGSISTLLIKQLELNNFKKEELVSNTYFLSTLGGVLSIFILSSYFLNFTDAFGIIFVLSILSFLCSLLLYFLVIKSKFIIPFFISTFILLIYYGVNGKSKIEDVYPNQVKVLYQKDGILGQILVLKDFNSKTKMLMVNNSIQTTTDFDDNGNYTHVKIITDYLKTKNSNSKEILIAGLGGGSMVKELYQSSNKIDVVEIDKNMIEVCQKHFSLPKSPKVNYYIDDARHFINSQNKKYDYIIFDLSLGETIPSNVYTLESFKKCKNLLKKDGEIIINFFSNYSDNGLKSIHAIGASLQENNFNVSLNKTVEKIENAKIGNFPFVFVASMRKNENLSFEDKKFPKKLVLLDENSKLDVYHREIVKAQRVNYIKFYKEYFSKLNY
jgi:spermidine synthase